MHRKAIASSYQRTACTTVKTMADLIGASFITSEGALVMTARYAVLQAEAQSLRYTVDGTTPTATNGFILPANSPVTLMPAELRAIKVIEVTAGGFANITLYSA